MAESMQGWKRTHRCTELSTANIGEEVTVMGWVQKQRNKGGIIFVDLRDRSGILQIIFEENDCGAEAFAKAEKMRSEFVIAVVGKVEKRSGAVNENLEAEISKYGTVERIKGKTRYETSVEIAEKFFTTPQFAVLAYAENFPDGLCGGPLSTVMNAPLILTKSGYQSAAKDYVQRNGISNGAVLGGAALIDADTAMDILVA